MNVMFTTECLFFENDLWLIFRLSDPAGMGFAMKSRLPMGSSLQAHLQEGDQGQPYRSSAWQKLLPCLSFNLLHPIHPCALILSLRLRTLVGITQQSSFLLTIYKVALHSKY
jgi:hypothetical protein